jgi:hypothetical protein
VRCADSDGNEGGGHEEGAMNQREVALLEQGATGLAAFRCTHAEEVYRPAIGQNGRGQGNHAPAGLGNDDGGTARSTWCDGGKVVGGRCEGGMAEGLRGEHLQA